MAMYDLCVVGAGMIGSAAARHASRDPKVKVCLIGPSEPKTRTMEDPRDIFGAYYDEGRITRCCDPDPVWATLAQESIARYRDIERESGIKFYHEVGTLMAGSKGSPYINNVRENANSQNVPLSELSNKDLERKYPYLKLAADDIGLREEKNAGHINPRNLVKAQIIIAKKQGCHVIDDVVCSVERVVRKEGSYVMRVVTEGGSEVVCKAVLIATGSYTTFRQLLPHGVSPDQKLFGLTVALLEVDKTAAKRLKTMPTVIYRGAGRSDYYKFPTNTDATVSYYMLPPIRYPDGRDYVKLGYFHGALPSIINTAAETKEWFVRGNRQFAEMTANFTQSLFKDVEMKSWYGDYCVMMETPTNRPYIDKVHAQLGVAIGGNGYAAKSSDEIGRLAADMMMGAWNSTLSRDVFTLLLDNGKTSCISKPKL